MGVRSPVLIGCRVAAVQSLSCGSDKLSSSKNTDAASAFRLQRHSITTTHPLAPQPPRPVPDGSVFSPLSLAHRRIALYTWPSRQLRARIRQPAATFTMASAADHDGLVLLRQSISASKAFIPSASADAAAPEVSLAQATHLRFPDQAAAVPIDSATRFVSNDKPVDLRSIYFAWLNREVAIPEYNASATKLNDELAAAGGSGKVQNLGFIERLDLITWLEGASEESEYIKPLASDKDAATTGAATAATTGAVSSATQARSGRGTMDPRLVGIYNGERRMGDRNTVLRGNKPTVCIFASKSD